MSKNIDEAAEDKAHRQNLAAIEAAKHDFEHWSKTGELRRITAQQVAEKIAEKSEG